MSVSRYVLGCAALACVCGALGIGALVLRRSLLPAWYGASARLAEALLGLALLVGILEALGTVGLFRLGPIVGASLAVGGGLAFAARGRASPAAASAGWAVHPLARAGAALVAGVVFAEWAAPTLSAYDVGIRAVDSLWYHLPWAATFAQTGHITPLHFTDVEYLTAFYPATGEVLHGLGIVLFGGDLLSPGLNLIFLGLSLLAAWCIGRPHGLGPATLTGAALAFATAMMLQSQAGSAANDVIGVFFLLAAVAMLVNAAPGARERAPVALAALSAGLAVSVKLSLLAPVLALSIAAIALAPPGQRRARGGLWTGCLVVAGGFWYLRNLLSVGNPLPWSKLAVLPTPAPPLQAHTSFSVAHYVFHGQIWSHFLEPGLASGLGSWWVPVLVLAILGPLACVLGRCDRTTRMLGLVALAAWLGYLLTPESAAGPAGDPLGFAFNLRYAAPALTLSLALLPLAAQRSGERVRAAVVAGLAIVLVATVAGLPVWRSGYLGGAVIVGACVVAGTLGGRRLARALAPRLALALAGAGVLLLAGVALGYAGERHYLHGRYVYHPHVSSLATLWQWFRGVHDARVGVVGTFGGFFDYPLYGLEDSNRVQYIARRGPHGSFTAIVSCPEWRRAINAGRYRYVVTTPGRNPWRPRRLLASPEGAWTASDPAARLVFRSVAAGRPVSVYELSGPLDPAACRPG